MPQDDVQTKLKQRLAEATPPEPVQEEPRPEPKKPMSPVGFAENLLDNIYEIGKGIVMAWPHALREGASLYRELRSGGGKYLTAESMAQSLKDTGKGLGKAMIDPYQKHGFAVLYHEPATVVLDAMSLLSFGGSSALRLGKMSGNARLIKLGESMKAMEAKIAQAVQDAPLRAIGRNPESLRDARAWKRTTQGQNNVLAEAARARLEPHLKGMSDAENALLDKVIHGVGYTNADLAAYPRVKAAYETLRDWVKTERESLIKERGLQSAEELEAALVKKVRDRMAQDGVHPLPDHETLRNAIRRAESAGEVVPLYAPAMRRSGGLLQLEDALTMPVLSRKGFTGYLERFATGAGASRKPSEYLAKSIRDFYKTKASMEYIDLARQSKYAKVVGRGEGITGQMPEGVLRRYEELGGKVRAQGTAASQGADVATAEGRRALRRVVDWDVADPTLKNLLIREFTQLGGEPRLWLQMYDRVIGLFKKANVLYNPKWLTGNAVGDAILSVLGGSSWRDARQLIVERKLPSWMQKGTGLIGEEITTAQRGMRAKFEELMSSVAQGLDDATRAGIITRYLRDKIKGSLVDYSASEEVMRRAIAETVMAPDEMARATIELQSIGEQMARGSRAARTIDVQLQRLGAKWKKEVAPHLAGQYSYGVNSAWDSLRNEINRLADLRQSIVADLRGRAIEAGTRRASIANLEPKAALMNQAVERANAFLGEYLALGPYERAVFRRLVPFYPWVKAMGTLAFRLPFIAPKTAFFWHRYTAALMDMMGDDELPDWTGGMAPVGVREDGSTVWVGLGGLSPFGQMRSTTAFGIPVPQSLMVHQQNPGLYLLWRGLGGPVEWQSGQVGSGETVVGIGDGSVYEIGDDGKWRKKLDQEPLTKALAYTFAPVQLADQLISDHDVRVGPSYNPDGTQRYPIELWERIAEGLGPKFMVRGRENIIQMEKVRIKKLMEAYRKAYRTASPEKRAYIEGVFRDYAAGHYRKIGAKP